MEPLEDKVAYFIEANRLFEGAARILLAVSGGADSIALLHAMQALVSRGSLNADLVCIHVNHQLRGVDSDGDEAFVAARAAELGIPALTKTVDVSTYATTQKRSIETAGRELRLACLGEVAQAQGCTWVATGHQKDDNAETVLQRLRRGTGFRGLAGIWPSRQFGETARLARPLLDCGRDEIVTYLQAHHQSWREDETNADCAHTRNYIRHRLLPTLQSESSDSLIAALGGLATSARGLYQRVTEQATRATAEHVRSASDECSIDAATLASLPEMVAVELVRRQLTALGCGERDLTRSHYQGILELAQPDITRKALTLPSGFLASREFDRVILQQATSRQWSNMPAGDVPISIPGTSCFADYRIEATLLDSAEFVKTQLKNAKSPFLEYLDLDRIDRPLIVRTRREGDRFYPLGLAGEKKVGKFLTAARVPRKSRQQMLIFEDDQKLVWVCPIRIDERAKVTEKTRQILMLKVTPQPPL